MNSITYLTLDLQAPNLAVVASAKQNDTLGRQIAATLRDGSAAFDATGLLCEIRYAKPDGTVGFYDTLEDNTTPAYVIDGNVVTFTLAEQMLTVAGAVYVDVNFYAATGEKLTAFAFVLQVEASVLADGTIESSDYYNVLTATLAQAAAVAEEAAEIAANLPVPYTGLPADLGTPSSGSATGFSRGDHVHQIPSAADLDVHYKIYSSVTELGLTSGSATLDGAWAAIPFNSILICDCNNFANAEVSAATLYGVVEIVKGDVGTRGWIRLYGRNPFEAGGGDWRMGINANGEPTGVWLYAVPNMAGAVNFSATVPSAINQNYTAVIAGAAGRSSVGVWSEAFGTVFVRDGFWSYHYVSPRDDYWHAGIALGWVASTGTLSYQILDLGESRSWASCTPSYIFF